MGNDKNGTKPQPNKGLDCPVAGCGTWCSSPADLEAHLKSAHGQ